MRKTKKVFRSAVSGKFVTKSFVKRSPKTTIVQRVSTKGRSK